MIRYKSVEERDTATHTTFVDDVGSKVSSTFDGGMWGHECLWMDKWDAIKVCQSDSHAVQNLACYIQ